LKIENKDCTSETLIEKVEKPVRNITVFQYFDEKIEIMKKTFKIGNSKTYIEAKRALSNFRNGKDLVFSDIDYRFLMRYKEHFQERKLAETSISVFLRTLRALYNSAIKENVARIENYPFNEFKISELNTDTKKRALSKSDLDKIKNFEPPTGTILHESKLYFLFSYYCQGINFNDIAKLQNKNIIDDRIEYVRTKTGKEIGFKILEPAKDIINYFRQVTGTNDNDYIFTILNKRKHITPVQIDNRINKVLKQVNLSLKEIGKLAGISTLLTTYVSRHTFATVLKKSGVSTDIISESLGHKSQKVTQIYLNSFENTTIDKAMENLL
jgi:site-specific recombinase XerD